MSRKRTPAGNILALARSREEQAKAVEETATSYMPTNVNLEALMTEHAPQRQGKASVPEVDLPGNRVPDKRHGVERPAPKGRVAAPAGAKRRRISLYLDDEVLTKIFRVSLERHEQLSSAMRRLILEALKARGL